GTAFWGFRLHRWLLDLAVQGASPQKRIVFFLLQAFRRARTLLVTSGHVTRRRLPKRLSLRAFESDNLLCHPRSTLSPPVERLLPHQSRLLPLRSSQTRKSPMDERGKLCSAFPTAIDTQP